MRLHPLAARPSGTGPGEAAPVRRLRVGTHESRSPGRLCAFHSETTPGHRRRRGRPFAHGRSCGWTRACASRSRSRRPLTLRGRQDEPSPRGRTGRPRRGSRSPRPRSRSPVGSRSAALCLARDCNRGGTRVPRQRGRRSTSRPWIRRRPRCNGQPSRRSRLALRGSRRRLQFPRQGRPSRRRSERSPRSRARP